MNQSSKPTGFFSKGQSTLLSWALCSLALFALLLIAGWAVRELGRFLDFFSPVLWPLAIAVILAILLGPVVKGIERSLKWRANTSIFALYLIVLSICGLGVWGVGGEVMRQGRDLAGSSLDWPQKIEGRVRQSIDPATWKVIESRFSQFNRDWKLALGRVVEDAPELTRESARALGGAWSGMTGFLSFFAGVAIIPIYLYYFLGSRRDHLADLAEQLDFIGANGRNDLLFLARQFKEIIETFFRGQLLIGVVMGAGYAIGFSLAGLKFGIALGLIFGVLNMVPYLGSVLGALTVLLVSYLQPGGILETGDWNLLLGCGITFVVVQVLESYWLSPKVMGNRTGLHPVVIIASVFFWGKAFGGVLGMILGIPLTAFLIVLWRLLRQKYLRA